MNQKSGGFTWSQGLMNSMMFLYKTRKCPMNKRGLCNFGDFCFDSHKDIVRRRPLKQNGEQWNYNPDDICIHSRNNKCQDYKRCHKCHNKQEHNFHPKIYVNINLSNQQVFAPKDYNVGIIMIKETGEIINVI